jgi:hypothetical protein
MGIHLSSCKLEELSKLRTTHKRETSRRRTSSFHSDDQKLNEAVDFGLSRENLYDPFGLKHRGIPFVVLVREKMSV